MKVIVIMLVGIIFILFLFIIKLKADLHHINRQTHAKLNKESHFIITNDVKMKEMTELCENLNLMYEKFYQAQLNELHKEKEFKEMLSSIAHDVRTPLTSVQGYLQMLREKETTKENESYYQIIQQRIDDIRTLLEQFFFYSKLLNNDASWETKSYSLYESCCQSLAGFYSQFVKANVEPQIHFDDPDYTIETNLDLLQRIFDNLIMNGLLHGKGDIWIRQSGDELSFTNEIEETCSIDVDRVFERFYKADPSRIHISSGLGLAIVKEIAEYSKIKVRVQLENRLFSVVLDFKDIHQNKSHGI